MSEHVIPSIDQCVGCENCKNICKKGAISFSQNDEGFFYPIVDENKCINCGACNKVCPIYQNPLKNEISQVGYAAISRIKALYKQGASAGAFGTIAYSFLNKFKDSLVVGAAWVDGNVKHLAIDKAENVVLLQNSKYVQSKLDDVVVLVKNALKNGKYVLFSGTPCQVNALKLFVGNECRYLFTIDLICHGVPSPAMLDYDLKKLGFHSVQSVLFRKKKKRAHSRSLFFMTVKERNHYKYVLNNRDLYYSLFLNEDTYRETCYKCEFANLSRVGDVTIGDCDSRDYINFNREDALNSVLINSDRGRMLWEIAQNNFNYCKLDVLKEAECNHQLREPCRRKKIRNTIYQEFFNNYVDLTNKNCKPRDFNEFLILLKFGYLR